MKTEGSQKHLQHATAVQHRRRLTTKFLKITGELISFNVTGIHRTQLTTCKSAQAKIGPDYSTEQSCLQLTVNSTDSMQVGKSVYDLREMRKSYQYLSCVAFRETDLKSVKVISGQKAYEFIRRLEYKGVNVKNPGQSNFHLAGQFKQLCQ